jgi:antirestriction protein ArdC
MNFYGNAAQVGEQLLEAFKEGRIPSALAPIFIDHNGERYCGRWSWLNQLIVALRGYSDARTYKGWQEVGRQVRKGEKGFHILEPMRITKVNEETGKEYTITVGFKTGARFGIEQTDGDPIVDEGAQQRFIDALPLIEVARSWGIEIATYNGVEGKAKGVFQIYQSGREVIAIGVENLSTWTHELIHVADHRLGTLIEKGQHWRSETVAELGGCILLHMLGKPEEADAGGAWEYIQCYAQEAGIEPLEACVEVLERTCQAVSLIISDSMDKGKNQEADPSCTQMVLISTP